jgi:hypothetical protein
MARHNSALHEHGTSREGVVEVFGVAIAMGGRVALYGAGWQRAASG